MCGILGWISTQPHPIAPDALEKLTDSLYRLSESRGKEASGAAFFDGSKILVLKEPIPASDLMRAPEFRAVFDDLKAPKGASTGTLALLGHSRLVTNGAQANSENNQPVYSGSVCLVHNGIVVNDRALWLKLESEEPRCAKRSEVDSEVLAAYLDRELERGSSPREALRTVFAALEGSASIAAYLGSERRLTLATNTGSLFFARNEARGFLVFASERFILRELVRQAPLDTWLTEADIRQVAPRTAAVFPLARGEADVFSLATAPESPRSPAPAVRSPIAIVDRSRGRFASPAALRRCTRCVLPETFPYLEFDADGVCSVCRSNDVEAPRGLETLRELCDRYRSRDGSPDCVVALSGGRDSCYGLHYVTRELGMKPVAYTYDWGMVTDIARRNQARLCGALGVEHILVSADIREKRRNIRRNVDAWLRQPELGMIPLFMAGDKQYFYFADQIRRRNGIELVFFFGNPLEKTGFKTGFCGVEQKTSRLYNVPVWQKAQLVLYYLKRFLRNPAYLNRSLLDTTFAFYSSYVMRHDFVWLFNYIPWNEDEIETTLKREYGWESASDSKNTWRIGDGTAAFYNYIYYRVAGFTEHDTFRSNQIRRGLLSRAEALERLPEDNAPRWDAMREYCRQIGIVFEDALEAIHRMPRLVPMEPAAAHGKVPLPSGGRATLEEVHHA